MWLHDRSHSVLLRLVFLFFIMLFEQTKTLFQFGLISEERQRQVHRKNIEWFCRGDVLLCYLFLSLTSVASRMHPLALLT